MNIVIVTRHILKDTSPYDKKEPFFLFSHYEGKRDIMKLDVPANLIQFPYSAVKITLAGTMDPTMVKLLL